MPAIVRIGLQDFAFKKDADALKVVGLMADAVPVEWKHAGDQEYYQPEPPDRHQQIELKIVRHDQLRPIPAKVCAKPREPLQLEDSQVRYTK